MRRLLSLLVLATPWKPPRVVEGCEKAEGRVVFVVVVVVARPEPRAPWNGLAPPPTISPGRTKRHLPSFVIGSLYACRRNLPLTRTSSDGGNALPFRRWKRAMASAV